MVLSRLIQFQRRRAARTSGKSLFAIVGVVVVGAAVAFFISRMVGFSNMRVPDGWLSLSDQPGEDGWVTRVREPKSGTVFRLMPSGKFRMGSPDSELGREADETHHWVQITKPFYISETETTQKQWERVMSSNPSRFNEERNPVERVSWRDAMDYCAKIGVGLPTEAQWEYACRAGTRSAYATGKRITEEQASFGADKQKNGEAGRPARRMSSVPVRGFPPNAWGLHDVHGNVYEWCADWYGEYPESTEEAPALDPLGPASGETRVLRGGAWGSEPEFLRSAGRDDFGPGDRNAYFGFRTALTP